MLEQIGELFETLVAFPKVIQAISDAQLLFEADSDDDDGLDSSDGSDMSSHLSNSPSASRLVSPRTLEDISNGEPFESKSVGGGKGRTHQAKGYQPGKGSDDHAVSFFDAQARISPPPQLLQFTRNPKLAQVESKCVGLRPAQVWTQCV